MDPRKIFSDAFGIEWIIAAIVFALICLTVLAALFVSHRRKRNNQPPSQRSKNTPLELTYGAVIAGVVGFIVFVSFRATAQEQSGVNDKPAAATVDVHGFQWCWTFDYPGHDRSVNAPCDHRKRPTMVVPVGVPVRIHVTSSDVIHSWFVPELRYKLDAFPNHVNTTTIVFDHAGRWLGHCAEFCGTNHYSMLFYLHAVPMKQYQQWLAGGSAGAPA